MFLKRIEIYGFKSFAQRSVLDFEYLKNGNITAVVGPNGSGKSNVADAIRWVTGEQSSKNLRSKKSEDVIFCGSSAKPRGSYAEVSLLLSGDKPVKFEVNNKEYELTEIEVSRKLYRSGESEYLINHKKVRLSDVNQLLATLGFGQSSYTVIGQGMVDRLLFFTASERKVLFDEAAGVKQYEIKREQSMRKLESTDANLIRLKDILTELEPRVVNLRRLVKRAEGRKEFEVELSVTQQKYFGSVLAEYVQTVQDSQEKQELLNKKIVQIDKLVSGLQAKIDMKIENPHTVERREVEAKITAITGERDQKMREVSYLKGQVESLGRNHGLVTSKKAELADEKTALQEKTSFLAGRIKVEQSEMTALAAQKSKLSEPVARLNVEVQSLEKELLEPAKDSSARIAELRHSIQDLTSKRNTSEEAKNKIDLLSTQKKALNLEIESNTKALQQAQKNADKAQGELNVLEAEMRKLATLVTPEVLTALDKAIVEFEKMPTTHKDYRVSLNKIFVQFREISKAVNSEKREQLDSQITALRSKYSETSKELVRIQMQLSANQSRLDSIRADITVAEAHILSKPIKYSDISILENELQELVGGVSTRQNTLLRKKDTLMGQLSVARDSLHLVEMDYNRKQAILANQESELESANRRLAQVTDALTKLESQKIEARDDDLEAKLKLSDKQLNKLEEDLAKYRGGLTQVIAAERELEQSNLSFEREKRALQDEKQGIQSQLSVLEIEIAKTQVRLEDLNEEIRLGNIILESNAKHGYLDQMEKDVLKLKMENFRRKLETIGGVDPETEAEFVELEARATEMAAQVTDLTKAKEDLEKVVAELDIRIKNQFADVFKNISGEFSRYFTMLFGGGTADLKLGEDESGTFGIEITANPPGKRAQSLNVLSGGERTLTSLALLFGILSVNPSPFCVLDEVDAALDESNTLRFVKILSDLAHKTQFIIISHNRDTMKVASSLYGVTMNDEHVSKLISVKLTEALVAAK